MMPTVVDVKPRTSHAQLARDIIDPLEHGPVLLHGGRKQRRTLGKAAAIVADQVPGVVALEIVSGNPHLIMVTRRDTEAG